MVVVVHGWNWWVWFYLVPRIDGVASMLDGSMSQPESLIYHFGKFVRVFELDDLIREYSLLSLPVFAGLAALHCWAMWRHDRWQRLAYWLVMSLITLITLAGIYSIFVFGPHPTMILGRK